VRKLVGSPFLGGDSQRPEEHVIHLDIVR
jgi:hypothetical protein